MNESKGVCTVLEPRLTGSSLFKEKNKQHQLTAPKLI